MSYLNVVAVLKHAPVFVEKAYSIVFTSYVHLIIHCCTDNNDRQTYRKQYYHRVHQSQ